MRSKTKKNAAQDATFVFKGTIEKLKASNVKQAAVSDRTVIAKVDEVIEAAPSLAGYKGQDITVELSGRRQVRVGDRLIFHATSWLFGDNIAVRSLYEEPDQAAGREKVPPDNEKEASKHFRQADLVVSGRVIEVRLPKATAGRNKRDAPSSATTHVSEHDPKWREAVIEINRVHKGDPSTRQVTVQFPSSTDVAWRRAPKLQLGQQGHFMLHKATRPNAAKTRTQLRTKGSLRSGKRQAAQTYIVRDPDDFTPE
ncbi:MAG TPA: hypothetical protein VE863_12835 [Pyrinomonadaceae bacterium]|jgi:hypothetical protein|nr:hypothetical protein [Pyrinomonadaceae bacterium]